MPKVTESSKFKTVGISPGTGATVLYTVPNNYSSIIRHLSVSNNNSAAKKVTVQYYDASTSSYYFIAEDYSIAANGYNNIVDGNFINLNTGDKIFLKAETAGTISALISLEEFYNPNR